MLSAEDRSRLDEIRSHYPDARAASVSVLKWMQRTRGWISDESLHDAADYLGLPDAELEGLATFYNLLFRKPVGRHVIKVCDSISCWMCGYERVRDRLQESLGIGYGETTPDGDFTLLPVVCLGDCDHAPVMMVDDDLHRNLAPERIDELLESLRAGGGNASRPDGVPTNGGDSG